jgi:hypothetical protein
MSAFLIATLTPLWLVACYGLVVCPVPAKSKQREQRAVVRR